MKDTPKLTKQEFALIKDSEFIKLKNSSIAKINDLMGSFREALKENMEKNNSLKLFNTEFSTDKISKGEKYLDLPYLVLDYPANFSKRSVIAFRTLFWWGNFFSFTFHLQGDALDKVRKSILEQSAVLLQSDFFICIHESPWHYHYEKTNYKHCKDFEIVELEQLLKTKSFLKISHRISLEEYPQLINVGLQTFNSVVSMLPEGY